MRNLVLLAERHRSTEFEVRSGEQSVICDLCRVPSIDGSDDCIILLTIDGILQRINVDGDVHWSVDLNQTSTTKGDWFDATFVDPNIVCLSKSGAIVTVSSSTGACELVGEFDHGLEAGKWSPDREVLFLVTVVADMTGSLSTVLLGMNGQLEVLSESPIEPHVSSGEADSAEVSMAWRPDGTFCAISSLDKGDGVRRIRTYSRGDLALNSIGRSEDGSGKAVPNLQSEIAWAGGGCSNLVTAVQRKGKRTQQVVFFEPNGLRHREFPLRPDASDETTPIQATVLGLAWNVESDLLAVSLREPGHNDKVQLWHRSNYHWYLKQELRYMNEQISCVRFDDEKAYVLCVALGSASSRAACWREYEFCWDPSSVFIPMNDSPSCISVSIDGCNLNMTPFDKTMIPPPMYLFSTELPMPIQEVSFIPSDGCVLTALVHLSDGSLILVGRESSTESEQSPCIVGAARWTATQGISVSSLRQIRVLRTSDLSIELVAVAPALVNERCEHLVDISMQWGQEAGPVASITKSTSVDGRILRMIHWSDAKEGVLIELDDGILLEYEYYGSGESRLVPSVAEPLLEPCPWISAIHGDASTGIDDDGDAPNLRLLIGRSNRGRLYCHDRLLSDSSSSFILSLAHRFLCYVTSDARPQCRFLPLEELKTFDPLMGSDENHLLEGYEPRCVERGARLVAILPMKPIAVLQMPRGNIEGIYPRALVLPYVMSKIRCREYGEAFVMMRRQKVDLNLIVDLDPTAFLLENGVNEFLERVTIVDHLNLFISCLQNVDVTQTRFRVPSWFGQMGNEAKESSDFDPSTKVNEVCRKIRNILLLAEEMKITSSGNPVSEGHFLLPILSTFAKENPPRLEDALSMIKKNALGSHPPTSKKPPLFGERAQSSIHYLAFLADYKILFDTALGMYDYDLARAVARNSQMDPKVYLPYLKRLRTLPSHYGKYEVDMRLKRYEAALKNLVQSRASSEQLDDTALPDGTIPYGNDFDHCMKLIQNMNLHLLGLHLFEGDDSNHRLITVSLGQQLLQKQESETALLVFLSAKPPDYAGAKRAARACGDWRYFFSAVIGKNGEGCTDDETQSLAYSIAEELASEQRGGIADRRRSLADAARILLDYCEDTVGAVDMLVKAKMWSEAHRISSMHSRQDLVKKCIDSCVSFVRSSVVDLESRTESFMEASERYNEVLEVRKAAIREADMPFGEGMDTHADDTGSLFSVASAASNSSVLSNMSGSSMGSATTVSSVISVGTQSSFTITGDQGVNKHHSKYNRHGKQKKKKRKPKRQRNRIKPGSEEELRSLVASLKINCIDSEFCREVNGTIRYVAQVGRLDLARTMTDSYTSTALTINAAQAKRVDAADRDKQDLEQRARKEGSGQILIEHPVEKEVNCLRCPELSSSIRDTFSNLR